MSQMKIITPRRRRATFAPPAKEAGRHSYRAIVEIAPAAPAPIRPAAQHRRRPPVTFGEVAFLVGCVALGALIPFVWLIP